MAYAEWLSTQTGEHYRLPTEAEWEYGARAGTQTKYWWGNKMGANRANCKECGSQWDGKQTAPVDSFPCNPFGLCDMTGNVWEWMCSEYEKKYSGKETKCINRTADNGLLAIRGGSWSSSSKFIRVTARDRGRTLVRRNNLGFRLVRM